MHTTHHIFVGTKFTKVKELIIKIENFNRGRTFQKKTDTLSSKCETSRFTKITCIWQKSNMT